MISTPSPEILTYYSSPGLMTDPGEYTYLFDDLPTNIGELCQLVQNNLLHVFWAERYGRELFEEEKHTVSVRPVYEKLAIIQQSDPRSLTVARALDKRQIGNCRDYTVLLTAILRYQNVPSRARCGFGAYFLPDHFEDHWVCEYWNESQKRWVLVDAQLDTFQCDEMNVPFDPLDVPRDQFVDAGQAWGMCRQGQAEPRQFGIFDMHGWWFIWGNVVRDLLAFNKVEILPWDIIPGCMAHDLSAPLATGSELALYDGVAALTMAGDCAFPKLRAIYDNDPRFQATSEIIGG